jgi:HEAT repeat protein
MFRLKHRTTAAAQSCGHPHALPRWDRMEDEGQLERVARWYCPDCDQLLPGEPVHLPAGGQAERSTPREQTAVPAGPDTDALRAAAARGDTRTLAALLRPLGWSGPAWASFRAQPDQRLWNDLLQVAARARHVQDRGDEAYVRDLIEQMFSESTNDAGEPVRRRVLLEGLGSSDGAVRAEAAEQLGWRGEPDALDVLLPLFDDREDQVRAAAVRAAGQLQRPEALPALLRALDRRDIVAAEATNGLVALGSDAVPALLEALGSESGWTRRHATGALGSIGDRRAIEPLVEALTDENAGVRWQAGYALVRFGEAALEPLLGALEHRQLTPWFVRGADYVLRRLPGAELQRRVTPLRAALHHSTAAVEVPVEAARLLHPDTLPPSGIAP